MQFTHEAYKNLIELLRENRYQIKTYHTWQDCTRCVILRHDIDNSIDQAVALARIEQELDVVSTYFVLLTSDFYNPASKGSLEKLRKIQSMGHELGLHFDEKAYPDGTPEETVQRILKECEVLSALLETEVSTVSMHRPSQATLDADLQIPGMVNSYGRTFFRDFKYLSDSRRRWREPVEEIIQSGTYDRLHILTHAFWYHQQEQTLRESAEGFITSANKERYCQLRENITDLESILREDEV